MRLSDFDVMGIAWSDATDDAWLRCDERQMLFAALPDVLGSRDNVIRRSRAIVLFQWAALVGIDV